MAETESTHEEERGEDIEASREGQDDQRDSRTTSWTIRGALIGAAAGGAAGAGLGALAATRPDSLRAVKDAVTQNGSDVARAAATAVSEVLTSRTVKQLLAGNGNGDRGETMKHTAREAGAAAAKAAREAILSLRNDGT